MGKCATVQIVSNNKEGFITINESDFNDKKHKLYVPKKATKK